MDLRARRVGRGVRLAVEPVAIEDLVGRDHQQVHPARGTGRGQHPGRDRVPSQCELRIERAAVDVGPGRGMDDDLGSVAVEPGTDPLGCVKVERVASPGDRPARAGERCVRERRDERAAEASAGPGDRDTHQPVGPRCPVGSAAGC